MSKKLSEHFSVDEIKCKCGCGAAHINNELISTLEKIRVIIGRPIYVTSGVRCESHNRAVGGAIKSRHMSGNAIDFYINGYNPCCIATLINLTCEGYRAIPYNNKKFVHIEKTTTT